MLTPQAVENELSEFVANFPDAGTAAQLAVFDSRTVVSASTGFDPLGARIDDSSQFVTFCLTKPLVALTVLGLIEDHQVEPLRPISALLDPAAAPCPMSRMPPCITDAVTVASLLTHSAGLVDPGAIVFRLRPPDFHGDLVAEVPPADGSARYSEYLGGWILEWLARSLGDDLSVRVSQMYTGMALDVMGDPSAERPVVPCGGLPERRTPMLSELERTRSAQVRPAFNLLASATGVAAALREMLDRLGSDRAADNGWPSAWLIRESFSWRRRGDHHDPVLGRGGEFAAGYMIDLEWHIGGSNGRRELVGHTAGYLPSLIALDLNLGRGAVLLANGFASGGALRDLRRSAFATLSAILYE